MVKIKIRYIVRSIENERKYRKAIGTKRFRQIQRNI